MAPSTSTRASQDTQLAETQQQLENVLTQQATLTDERNTLQQSNETLEQEVRLLRAELNSRATQESSTEPLEGQVRNESPLRGASLAPTTLTASTATTRTFEPKVASPEYFMGHRSKLSSFITQVTMVILLQPSRFPSEESKVLFAGSFLRDTAFLWFQPWVTTKEKPLFMLSFDAFCAELRKTFGDPDEVKTAERQLYALKQKGSASAYLADFMRYAVLVKWNDEAKAAQFYRGLKEGIKDELARVGIPQQFKDLQEAAVRIDTRLFERQVEKGEHYPRATYTSSYTRNTSRPTTYSKTSTVITRPASDSLHVFHPSNNQQRTRRGKLTPTEYQRRKDNNLCLYCGEKGHQVLKCPIAPPPKRINKEEYIKVTSTNLSTNPNKQTSPNAGKV